MRNFTLTQLIKPEVLQQIQDAFSDFTGLAAVTTNADGVPVTRVSNFTNFCTNIIRGTDIGLRCCQKCDKDGAVKTMHSGCPVVYRCHAGLIDFAAPIMFNGRMIGSFVGGQALPEDLDDEFCRKKAMEYGIDPELYIAEAKKAVLTSPEQVERSAKLIYDISKALSSLAMQSFSEIEKSRSLELAARSQSDYIMDVISDILKTAGGYVHTAREAIESGDPQKMKSALELITNEGSGTTGMIYDSLTYLKMVGKNFQMNEDQYDPHATVAAVVDNISRRLESTGVDLSLELSDKLPKLLLGDAGSMCQLIDKLISLSVDHGGRNITVSIDSTKSCYAELINIKIVTDKLAITDEQLETVNKLMVEDNDFAVSGSFQELGLPLARSLLHSMSGEFCLKRSGDGAEYIITIPQLEVKGGAV